MKSIAQLREKAPYVLKRKGHAKQKKKLLKAYGGKRLNKSIRDYAAFEEMTISEMKKMEFDFYRDMKGGHHHRRNYCICSVCGKWFRRNKGRHYDYRDGTYHFCCGPCDGHPHFIRYCFSRTHLDDGYFERIINSFMSARYCERYYK